MNAFIKKISIAYFLLFTLMGYAETKQLEEITIKINIVCPPSEQLEDFKKSIPNSQIPAVSYEDFQKTFIENMKKLCQLVESGKVSSSNWSVELKSDQN